MLNSSALKTTEINVGAQAESYLKLKKKKGKNKSHPEYSIWFLNMK